MSEEPYEEMYTVQNVLRNERILAHAEPIYMSEYELERFFAVAREVAVNHCVEMRGAAYGTVKVTSMGELLIKNSAVVEAGIGAEFTEKLLRCP